MPERTLERWHGINLLALPHGNLMISHNFLILSLLGLKSELQWPSWQNLRESLMSFSWHSLDLEVSINGGTPKRMVWR